MDSQTLIAITAIVVSGAVGIAGAALNIRKYRDSDSIDRAARRTSALQMLSDEEFALDQVLTECQSIDLLIAVNRERLRNSHDHLQSESQRILAEAKAMIHEVRERRKGVELKIRHMTSAEIEQVIAEAYQGRMKAEAQLKRTRRSREDTIYLYLS